jgi:hypothetical protein
VRLAAARARQRLGRRGWFLADVGVAKICLGISFVTAPPVSGEGRETLTRIAPLWSWSLVWIVAGVIAFVAAWLPVGRDRVGFVVALLPPSLWVMALLWATFSAGYGRGVWVAGWLLAGHIRVILWAAGVPEHSVPPMRRPRE